MHAAVLTTIRRRRRNPDLTIRERLMLGLGAAALGDSATARAIARPSWTEYGEAGRATRPDSGSARSPRPIITRDRPDGDARRRTTATRSRPGSGAYVEANPGLEATYALHPVGLRGAGAGASGAAAGPLRLLDRGARKVVDLDAGEGFHVLR